MEILSEKCNLNKDEVREKYETFQSDYPEGEITKDQFLKTMKASEDYSLLYLYVSKCFRAAFNSSS